MKGLALVDEQRRGLIKLLLQTNEKEHSVNIRLVPKLPVTPLAVCQLLEWCAHRSLLILDLWAPLRRLFPYLQPLQDLT